jgi:hypothetical protein
MPVPLSAYTSVIPVWLTTNADFLFEERKVYRLDKELKIRKGFFHTHCAKSQKICARSQRQDRFGRVY